MCFFLNCVGQISVWPPRLVSPLEKQWSLQKIIKYTMKWSKSRSVMFDSLWPCGLQPTRLLCPWEFSSQEYWRGLPCPSPGYLPNPGIESRSPTLQADSLPSEPPGKPKNTGVGSLFLLQGMDLPNPGIELGSPSLQVDSFTSWATREALIKRLWGLK